MAPYNDAQTSDKADATVEQSAKLQSWDWICVGFTIPLLLKVALICIEPKCEMKNKNADAKCLHHGCQTAQSPDVKRFYYHDASLCVGSLGSLF